MNKLLFSAGLLSLTFLSCDVLNHVEERLNIMSVKFDYDSINVGIFPTVAEYTSNPLAYTEPSDIGVVINCVLDARNENSKNAAFDGAVFNLRVQDTSKSAQAATTTISPFTISASTDTQLVIPFRISLDNPVFSQATLLDIVQGNKIPYKLDASLFFNLITPDLNGGVDTLGSKEVDVDLVADSISTRPDPQTVDFFLNLLEL